ncbi:dehydrogenase/reductase SDR family member 7 isoform X2 [Folsomia candida]|nr:dehydrogenase/reductase SDR family member 7 isoform X2 [Folsomia candida]XP_035706245.1 dehydrogenase/reductase SDR family member 7 isoform X2 [Folsomia candida]XP_035706249.1 dehydrogenase/reductase SDR family member 7 isoform X2 [Folsomia candida]XP_035706250.1 dehydrogenase/reductase SDR family member 7 isoform X2 [Folsomia candida]XP_035706257.1 dehydrogenase/reductase SDR family member 7 isoform X2 [Folsomia candida]
MDIILAAIIAFFVIWIGIIFYADSDILTFLYWKFGKDPASKFHGKVVWITGASSGIGEGLAKELAKCTNVKIVLSARRKDELERVKKECLDLNKSIKPDSILVLPFDMTDYSSHKTCLETITKKFYKLDILVSNAGMSQRAAWDEIEIDVDKKLFELNVFSVINLNRVVLKYFKANGNQGQLAVMSSLGGKVGGPNASSYAATKFALHGYFESLRNEMRGTKIHVTLLCPGPVVSNIGVNALTGAGEKSGSSQALVPGKKMSAERCGELCLVSIGNKLEESWISNLPYIPIVYFATHQPFLFSKVFGLVGRFAIKKPSK